MKLCAIFYKFVSSTDVEAILFYTFRVSVSYKSICEWDKKFPEELPNKKVKYKEGEDVILFTDEKFVWIKKVQAYWWSIKDHCGNVLTGIITFSRDTESAKRLLR